MTTMVAPTSTTTVNASATGSFPIVCTNPNCDEKKASTATTSSSSESKPLPKCALTNKCVEACAAYGRVCPCISRSAGRAACEAIKKMRENSLIFTSEEPKFRKLNPDDLLIQEQLLGEGGFSVVKACTLKTDPDRKLAIKYLKRKAMVNQHQFEHGASDLAQEAHFLSELKHPHIIQLHGVTAGSVQTNVASGKDCGFFIIVDRLYDTLEKRLERWREEQVKQNNGLLSRMTRDFKERKRQELRERLKVAFMIADAVCYLHDRNIIFRDLKPDNVGFDSEGVLKLFDFGLAKELKPGQANADGRYELTGNTGSRRYMAPEVAKEMPYNKSVDSYSFGILLHEILTAEKPFHGYSCGKHMSLVVIGGERPKMDSTRTAFWPLNLQWIMKRCWSPFPEMRPDFHAIRKTLLDVLEDRENTHMADVSHSSVASTEDASTAHLNGTTTATTTHSKHGKSSPLMNPIGALLRSKRSSSKGKDSASPYNPVKAQGPAATGKRTSPWGWAFRK